MSDFIRAEIKEIREELPGIHSFFFCIPEGMTWGAGADMHFAHPDFMAEGEPDKTLIRHMSVITLPEEGRIGFTTRVPGSGSVYKKRLEALAPGDEMVMFKLGNRIPLRREGRPVVLISMGVGMAAMRPFIKGWLNNPEGVPSLTNLVVDKKDRFVFREEMEETEADDLTHIFAEGRDSFTSSLDALTSDVESLFYIVGGDRFLDDTIARLKAKGVARENIELDKKADRKAELLG